MLKVLEFVLVVFVGCNYCNGFFFAQKQQKINNLLNAKLQFLQTIGKDVGNQGFSSVNYDSEFLENFVEIFEEFEWV